MPNPAIALRDFRSIGSASIARQRDCQALVPDPWSGRPPCLPIPSRGGRPPRLPIPSRGGRPPCLPGTRSMPVLSVILRLHPHPRVMLELGPACLWIAKHVLDRTLELIFVADDPIHVFWLPHRTNTAQPPQRIGRVAPPRVHDVLELVATERSNHDM